MKPAGNSKTGAVVFVVLAVLLGVYFAKGQHALWKLATASPPANVALAEANRGVANNDPGDAAKIYAELAKKGNAEAQYKLAGLYLTGAGSVPKDTAKALALYETSAKKGWDAAKAELGHLYFNGDQIEQNFNKARHWLALAANDNNARSQYELGMLWKNGWGGEKDLSMAYAWLELAAANGSQPAIDARDALLKTLPPAKVAEGQNLIKTLRKGITGQTKT